MFLYMSPNLQNLTRQTGTLGNGDESLRVIECDKLPAWGCRQKEAIPGEGRGCTGKSLCLLLNFAVNLK